MSFVGTIFKILTIIVIVFIVILMGIYVYRKIMYIARGDEQKEKERRYQRDKETREFRQSQIDKATTGVGNVFERAQNTADKIAPQLVDTSSNIINTAITSSNGQPMPQYNRPMMYQSQQYQPQYQQPQQVRPIQQQTYQPQPQYQQPQQAKPVQQNLKQLEKDLPMPPTSQQQVQQKITA